MASCIGLLKSHGHSNTMEETGDSASSTASQHLHWNSHLLLHLSFTVSLFLLLWNKSCPPQCQRTVITYHGLRDWKLVISATWSQSAFQAETVKLCLGWSIAKAGHMAAASCRHSAITGALAKTLWILSVWPCCLTAWQLHSQSPETAAGGGGWVTALHDLTLEVLLTGRVTHYNHVLFISTVSQGFKGKVLDSASMREMSTNLQTCLKTSPLYPIAAQKNHFHLSLRHSFPNARRFIIRTGSSSRLRI